jgi:YndJ-like protein
MGFRVMGFQEPIPRLTAVHFHYTGFSSALILAAILKAARSRRGILGPLKWLASLVLFVPFLLAAGFLSTRRR